MENEILTPQSVSNFLGCNKQTVLKWIRQGKFKAEKIKKGLIFIYSIDYESLKVFLLERGYLTTEQTEPIPGTTLPGSHLDNKSQDNKTPGQRSQGRTREMLNSEKHQEQQKHNLFIIKVLGLKENSFLLESGKITDNKSEAVFFISELAAENFITHNVKRKFDYEIIVK